MGNKILYTLITKQETWLCQNLMEKRVCLKNALIFAEGKISDEIYFVPNKKMIQYYKKYESQIIRAYRFRVERRTSFSLNYIDVYN